MQKKAFGPVSIIAALPLDFDEALKLVNDSQFGLQAGILLKDIYKAHKAWTILANLVGPRCCHCDVPAGVSTIYCHTRS